MDTMPEIQSAARNVWTKLEKRFGAVTSIAILGVAGFLGISFAPLIMQPILTFLDLAIQMVGKGIFFSGLVVLAYFLYGILTNPRTWTLLWNFQMMIIRKITKAALGVQSFSISVLEAFVDYLNQKLATIRQKRAIVAGQRDKLANKITAKENERASAKESSQIMLKSRKPDGTWTNQDRKLQFDLDSEKIGMIDEALKSYRNQLKRMELFCSILEKMDKATDFYIKKTKFKVETLVDLFESTKETAEATRAITELFGTDDKKKVFDMAVNHVEDEIASLSGEIDTFLNSSGEFLLAADTASDVYEDRLLNELTQWDQRANTLVSMAETESAVIAKGDKGAVLSEIATSAQSKQAAATRTQYSDLLKR